MGQTIHKRAWSASGRSERALVRPVDNRPPLQQPLVPRHNPINRGVDNDMRDFLALSTQFTLQLHRNPAPSRSSMVSVFGLKKKSDIDGGPEADADGPRKLRKIQAHWSGTVSESGARAPERRGNPPPPPVESNARGGPGWSKAARAQAAGGRRMHFFSSFCAAALGGRRSRPALEAHRCSIGERVPAGLTCTSSDLLAARKVAKRPELGRRARAWRGD
ncbi:hypothetical protein BC628DRAFT_822441 [Trametes gibbosa]|nr:hypothetical protein BC628DRAFT_822441 [Trametes gibbosa]